MSRRIWGKGSGWIIKVERYFCIAVDACSAPMAQTPYLIRTYLPPLFLRLGPQGPGLLRSSAGGIFLGALFRLATIFLLSWPNKGLFL